MFKLITEKRLQDVDDNLYTYAVYGNDLLLQTLWIHLLGLTIQTPNL